MVLWLLCEIMGNGESSISDSHSGWIQCANCTVKFEVQTVYPDTPVEYCPVCGDTIDEDL